jgi:hypothetical protein
VPDLNKIAESLTGTVDLPGALALAHANGLSLHDTFTLHALVLSNRILRAPMMEYDDARVYFSGLIRPSTDG